MADGPEGEGEGVEAVGVGGVPEHGAVAGGRKAGGETLAEGVAGRASEGEGLGGKIAAPIGSGNGIGIKEMEDSVRGEFGRGGSGKFGDGENAREIDTAIFRGLGDKDGREKNSEPEPHPYRVAGCSRECEEYGEERNRGYYGTSARN
jgi:hypothetical protein